MGLIHVLDTEVSNKIAAGEVVERPLSIVKELIENSIDAGASAVTIEIRGGGAEYIRVTDNGSGMSAEDAKLCFLRHATSKIQTGSDLEAIYTLGFRGEALSSIGAVSKVKLTTKRRADAAGTCVSCEGGEILSSSDSGAPNGTIMEVRDLFYNTPARLKFLKKPATESGYISDIVSRYIFAHPEISFRLVRDGKEVVFSAGDSRLINAVYAVYGKDYARNMLDVDYEYNGIRVIGVIGKGTLARANRNYQSFFVNKRYIKSAIMIRALEEAYKNQIMISKFPTAILNIEIDAKKVDINVHPTKLECKFANEQEIYQAVYHAAKSTLYAIPNVPEIEREPEKKERAESTGNKAERGVQSSFEDLFRERLKKSMQPESYKFKTERRADPIEFEKSAVSKESKPAQKRDLSERVPAMAIPEEERVIPAMPKEPETQEENILPKEEPKPKKTVYEMLKANEFVEIPEPPADSNPFAELERVIGKASGHSQKITVKDPDAPIAAVSNAVSAAENHGEAADELVFDDGYFRVIGQLFDTYILVEKDNRLLMIDQHAAHERLNYEALKLEMEQTGVMSQMILEPVEIKLTGREFAAYSEHTKLFEELGFEVSSDDESKVSISSVPGDISWSEIEPLFLELLTQVENMSSSIITEAKQRLLYTISCKAAIKANMHISEEEMSALVKKVFALKNINTCPHGRPIVISMTKKEIEKDFKRIV